MQENSTFLAHLEDRRVLRVTGGDARDFLNGLVTGDVAKLADGGSCHAGLLTPQGKILFEFLVHQDGDAFLIDVAEAAAADLSKRLGFYKLRADVEITALDGAGIGAAWGDAPCFNVDPRLEQLGARFFVEDVASAHVPEHFTIAKTDDYEAHRIALGVPESLKDYPLGDAFPHDVCFDQLAGVSFTKGCYVGQEVVSRMRHRGTARRRIVHVTAEGDLPSSGTDILAGDRSIGVLGSSVAGQGLAVVRLDRAAKAIAAGTSLVTGERAVTLRVPAWADYSLELAGDAS